MGSLSNSVGCKRPITMYLSLKQKFLYNTNIKENMEENKMSKQIVPLDVNYSSKKEGKSNAIILNVNVNLNMTKKFKIKMYILFI